MIEIKKVETYGWDAAIRGMRNPMNSWDKSDSYYGCDDVHCYDCRFAETCQKRFPYSHYEIGEADLTLMKKLVLAGSDHRKFLRQIMVSMDIIAPLYWWKEFDTYKVGTVANSCSTMHKLPEKEFTLDDFSHEHLAHQTKEVLQMVIDDLNDSRSIYLKTKNKGDWWQMIQLLPSSYNQLRTVTMNYEVLLNMYHARKDHKLDEWRTFCEIIADMPYFMEVCIDA